MCVCVYIQKHTYMYVIIKPIKNIAISRNLCIWKFCQKSVKIKNFKDETDLSSEVKNVFNFYITIGLQNI